MHTQWKGIYTEQRKQNVPKAGKAKILKFLEIKRGSRIILEVPTKSPPSLKEELLKGLSRRPRCLRRIQ
jgi:hypothetical protein